MSRALRYIALVNGCSLVFVTKEEEALIAKFRSLLYNNLFKTKVSRSVVKDYTKPLMIPSGSGTMAPS
jgi:hypothetical protein